MTSPAEVKVVRPRRKRRGAFHHGDLAEQLVITAAAIIESDGHAALSLKKVAARLGVTEPALYRHYESRDHLLVEVAVRGLLEFMENTGNAARGIDDPFDSMRAYGRAYVRNAAARPGWFRLMFSRFGIEAIFARFPHAMDRVATAEAANQQVIQRWRAALPPGDDRFPDLYRLLWGTVHGLAGFVVERVFQLVETDEERIAAADVAIDMLIDSLRARASL